MSPLLEAQRKGVTTYVLVYKVPEKPIEPEVIRMLGALDRVKITVSGDHFVVKDSSLAVISYRKWRALRGEKRGLVVEEPLFISYIVRDFFKNWLCAQVIKDSEVNLPLRLTVHHLALLEARNLLSKGIKLYGKFKGWWVDNGENDVIRGSIIDTVLNVRNGIMHFVVKTKDGIVRAGGPDAIIEEFATREVFLRQAK